MRRPRSLAPVLAALLLAPTALAQHVLDEEVGDGFNGPLGVDDGTISPDGRWLVLRDNTVWTTARVYDLWNPGPPAVHDVQHGLGGQGGYDSAVATNERAAVIGTGVLLLDLTQPGAPPVAARPVGDLPHDLAVSEATGTLCVRGGTGAAGGSFVFDLATGAQLLQLPGELPFSFDPNLFLCCDSVVASDRHAIFLSELNLAGAPLTRFQVVDLAPPGGGPPILVFESSGPSLLNGRPVDLALAPDGQHVAVRSEFEVALVSLAGANPAVFWVTTPDGGVPPQGEAMVDAIEMTNTQVVTTSTWFGGGSTHVDVWDLAGDNGHAILPGLPHDLGVTPDGTRAVVRTQDRVALFDLTDPPAAGAYYDPASIKNFPSSHVGFFAGLDSVALNDTHAVVLARNLLDTRARVFDLTGGELVRVLGTELEGVSSDVAVSPSGDHAVISGLTRAVVIDLRIPAVVLDHDSTDGGAFGWSDGVAVADGVAATFGYGETLGPAAFIGWVTAIDLFEDPTELCPGAVNSTGEAGRLVLSGSARESANDLTLWAAGVPEGEFGAFRYGDQAVSLPFGDGTWCVGGQSVFFPRATTGNGKVSLAIDAASLPAGGGSLVAGTTWHFQYAYRDHGVPGGAGFSATSAVTVTIEP